MEINKIIYCGHSAILLENPDYVIGIDPWLEGNPVCPENLKNPSKLDLIILTHGHSDHSGDCVRLAKKYNAKVIATFELASLLVKAGVPSENLIFMNTGGSVTINNYKISLTPAFHSSSYTLDGFTHYAGQPCGVVVEDNKNVFYHAGDTDLFSDLKLIGAQFKPTISFLPIGDVFTMDSKKASIAASWLGTKVTIPIHYKTFPQLYQSSDEFNQECQRYNIECVSLDAGQEYKI